MADAIAQAQQVFIETEFGTVTITYVVTRNRVEIGTNVIYGAIHQLGGFAGRAAGKAGPTRRPFIPARPYLGMSGADKT